MEKTDLLTVREAAERLRMSYEGLRRWCKAERIRATRMGKKWMIPLSEIDRIIREGVNPIGKIGRQKKETTNELGHQTENGNQSDEKAPG